MRIVLVAFAAAFASSSAYAAETALAHICGDARLSSTDQADCRAQMDRAKTDVERARIQQTFDTRSKASDRAGGSSIAAQRNAPSKAATENGPATAPTRAPADSYPPGSTEPPAYPGETPTPRTGKPPA